MILLLILAVVIGIPFVFGMLRIIATMFAVLLAVVAAFAAAAAAMVGSRALMVVTHRALLYAGAHRLEAAVSLVAVLAAIVVAVILARAALGALRDCAVHFNAAVRPALHDRRMRRAIASLRRARRPINAIAVARTARVDHESALAFLMRRPDLAMPSFTVTPRRATCP